MATLRQASQEVLAEMREGIAWIALWKEGRGWCTEVFYPDSEPHSEGLIEVYDYEIKQIEEIVKTDPKAAFLNSHYYNFGDEAELNRDELSDKFRWHYERETSLLGEYDLIQRAE